MVGRYLMFFQQISHETDTNTTGQTKFITITCAHYCPLASLHQHHLHLLESTEFHTQRLYSDRAGYLSPFSLHSSSTNLISKKFSDSAVIVAISVSRRCTLDLSVVKTQGSIAGFSISLLICNSTKSFTDHFVTSRVDFGIAFSITFLSSSALLGF